MSVSLTNEELEAECYVLTKIMVRPSITIFSVGIHFFVFLYSVIGVAFLLLLILEYCKIRFPNIRFFVMNGSSGWYCLVVSVVSFVVTLALFSKRFLIGLVHVYQKYAPESRRRMCLFKPTCSEYAILALNKYGSILGSIKTINRLRRCKGTKYHVDYP